MVQFLDAIFIIFIICLVENNFLSESHFGFKPVDSCINQLLAITYEIYSSFDENYELRVVFLDKTKAVNNYGTNYSKIMGIIQKLQKTEVSGNLLNFLTSFLNKENKG